jgi:hypothetical protein
MQTGPQIYGRHSPSAKVNLAVETTLAACRNSAAPIVSLASVIDDLRFDPNWTDDEIRQFERATRRILARIVR